MSDLRYAIRENVLISIEDVPSGLECNCTCPNCGAVLIAKKGNNRKHHFAHYEIADCEHGAETALHVLAKNIIAETKTVWVPNRPKNVYDTLFQGKVLKFENSYIEQQLSPSIRSDVLLKIGGRKLNVEIKVTHGVDEFKKINLFNEGIATIEIDLSGLADDYSEELVREYLLDGRATKLIYSPKAKDVYAKLWLGEWKEVHKHESSKAYVNNCPMDAQRAYFAFFGSRHECNECWGYEEYDGGSLFLCRGKLGNLKFTSIDKIIEIQKIDGRLQYAELIVDGSPYVFGTKNNVSLR